MGMGICSVEKVADLEVGVEVDAEDLMFESGIKVELVVIEV